MTFQLIVCGRSLLQAMGNFLVTGLVEPLKDWLPEPVCNAQKKSMDSLHLHKILISNRGAPTNARMLCFSKDTAWNKKLSPVYSINAFKDRKEPNMFQKKNNLHLHLTSILPQKQYYEKSNYQSLFLASMMNVTGLV